ncbi:S8 family peptidase [Acetivibrio saccincola]|nr:S8 family peptidase [Acetivibrio saccincola]
MFKKGTSLLVVVCIIISTVVTGFGKEIGKETAESGGKSMEEVSFRNAGKLKKPGELIVKYKEKPSFRAMSNVGNGEKILKSGKNGLVLIEVEENEVTEKIESLMKDENVEYVVPNYVRKAFVFPLEAPDDPEFINQWGLANINAPDGWRIIDDFENLNEVTVAVIDTGIDMFHEDLKDVIVGGYDFVDMDDDSIYGPVKEEHASHVAGIIAALTNNGVGISGTCGQAPVKIMPIRALESGWGDDFTIIESIYYAVDNGADIINMSFGGNMESEAFNEAIEYALSKGVVLVAATGNESKDAFSIYPAAHPGVIAVSATDEEEKLVSFSNYGSIIDIAAPGVNIISTVPGNKYDYFNGTSLSTAFVSAACALLLSKNPSLNNIEIQHILENSAKDIGDAGKDEKYGYGLLNIGAALMTEEVRPRLEIMNLMDGMVVYDVIDVQTRFTYPENIEKTELYVNNRLVDAISEKTDIFHNFKIDTQKYNDGPLTIKVVAYEGDRIHQKEVTVEVRNTVYTGLKVKLTHKGEPVSNGIIEVWNKYTAPDGKTYYNFVHYELTEKNGVAVVPGSEAPNGNTYVIIAYYLVESEGDYSSAIIVEETMAPDIVELDGKDLVPVTVKTGLENEGMAVYGAYKFEGSEQSILFNILPNTSGEFKAFLNKGIYSFEAFTYNQGVSKPLYALCKKDVLIDGRNTVVNIQSDKKSLAKISINYKNIYGFRASGMYVYMREKDSMISKGFYLEDISYVPEIYATPGEYVFQYNIKGNKGKDEVSIFMEGKEVLLKKRDKTKLSVGGIFTGKMKIFKSEYVPGEFININPVITDSQGNMVTDAVYVNNDPFSALKNQNFLFYRKDNKMVAIKQRNSLFEVPDEPIEFELKNSATIELIDRKNNVVKSIPQYTAAWMGFELDQDISGGNYRLKMISELPYLIQDSVPITISREAKKDAVKFNIELPGEEKAGLAVVEAVNTETGERYYQFGENLLNGEMFVSLPDGKYKAAVYSHTSDIKQVTYLEDICSPGEYNLNAESLENVKFSIKDDNNNGAWEIVNFKAVFPRDEVAVSEYEGSSELYISSYYGEKEFSCFVSRGVYNIVAEVLGEDTDAEYIILKEDVEIDGDDIEFTTDNLTEVSLDDKSDGDEAVLTISDPETGLNVVALLGRDNSFKISKGFYDVELTCEKVEYGNAYSYVLSSWRDFSKDNTKIIFGTKFSASIYPDKMQYRKRETLNSEHFIMDRFGNRLISSGSLDYFYILSDTIKEPNGKAKIRLNGGKYEIFDKNEKTYVEIPYDIRAPFVYIINSKGETVFSKKSSLHYTNSQIKLEGSWAKKGDYKVRLTIDIDSDGSLSGEAPFKIK